jgi:Putative Actinobacterial Holin-X, holin superfamily III
MEEVVHTSSSSAGQETSGSRSMSKDVTDLVDTYIALAKANVTQKAADAASVSVTGILIAVLAFLFIFFGAFALAWWLGQLISSIVGGFLIVAGIFGVGVALIFAFKKQLIYPGVRNMVVKKVYE